MSKIIIYSLVLLTLPIFLQAQYLGGNGRGDVSVESLNIPLSIKGDNFANPLSCSLQQNYPNPFNKTTNITFNVVQTTRIKIVVFDITGREVKTLLDKPLIPGYYEISFDATSLKSGIYFCKIAVEGNSETKLMIVGR